MQKSTCPRVSIFKRLKGRNITKQQDKGLKISHSTWMMKEGRMGVNKKRKSSKGFDTILQHERDPHASANTRKRIL